MKYKKQRRVSKHILTNLFFMDFKQDKIKTRMINVVKMTIVIIFICHYYKVYFSLSLSLLVILVLKNLKTISKID